MSEDTAIPSTSEWQTFAEVVAQDNAVQLIAQLPDDMLARFSAELDQAAANRIWEAGEDFGDETGWGAPDLLDHMLHLARLYPVSAWKRFHAALIPLAGKRYLDWCQGRIRRISANDRDYSEPVGMLGFVLAMVIESVGPEDARELTSQLLTMPHAEVRVHLLNQVAAVKMHDGKRNPILVLAEEGNAALAASVRAHWEMHFDETTARGSNPWRDPMGSSDRPRLPAFAGLLANHCPAFVALEVGYSAGIRAATPDEVAPTLEQLGAAHGHDVLVPLGTLWFFLNEMHEVSRRYGDNETELAGLRAGLLGLVEKTPRLWVEALRWILLKAQPIKREVIAITSHLGQSNAEVGARLYAMRPDPQVSTLAMGIQALIDGIARPADGHTLALADSLAHYFDGTPKFPSPLALRSATWLGSDRLEKYLRDGVARACQYFARHVLDYVSSVEEALTATLMHELVMQFRDSEKMAASARSETFGVPALKLSQREIAKSTEEPLYGCDLAFLVKVHAEAVYRMEWVDLVQVKKTQAKTSEGAVADTWKIDIAQLQTLIGACASAVYFLICARGEVLVVPARHLMGFVRGKAKTTTKSRTLGYNDVRSAAIPLEQYLVDLLIGQWSGTTAPDTLAFVTGNATLRPRHVVEVEIEFGPRQRG